MDVKACKDRTFADAEFEKKPELFYQLFFVIDKIILPLPPELKIG